MSLCSLGGYNILYSIPNGIINLIIYDRVNAIGGWTSTLKDFELGYFWDTFRQAWKKFQGFLGA